jgi:tetratricopeptide (TPR) repeat protein
MKTLYDLLGALPEDNADDVRAAFRKAAKAVHPDTNPDDPDAALRLRQVMRAHAILGDPQQRAAYDRLLTLTVQQPRPKPKPATASRAIRKFAFDAIAVALLSTTSIGGYLLFEQLSKAATPPPQISEVTATAPVEAAAVAPAPQLAAAVPDKPPDKPDAAAAAPDRPPDKPDALAAARDGPPGKSDAAMAARDEPSDKPDSAAVASETIAPGAVAPATNTDSAQAAVDTRSALANAHAGPAPEPSGPNAGSDDAKAFDLKALDVKALDAKTVDAKADEPESFETKSVDAKPVETKSVETKTYETRPYDARSYWEHGIAAYRDGDLSRAIADFDQAIRFDRNFADAYVDRGIALYRLHEFDRAFADITRVKRIRNLDQARAADPPAHKASPSSPRN